MKSKENYSGFKGILKFISSIISWTILVILILLALFLVYYTVSTRIAAKNGGKFEPFLSLYTIVSGSMEPNIKVYDVVVTTRVNKPSDIKVGDVITFSSTSSISRGWTITHRVIEIVENENGVAYRTKGDNNLSPDTSPAEYKNLKGKVIFRIPGLGRVQSFLGTQSGWLIVIVIPALIIIISDILKIFKLTGVKNKIEKIDEDNKRIKMERAKRETKRKEDIKKRLKLEKNMYEPDPIVTKKPTKIVVADKISNRKENAEPEEKILSRSQARYAEAKENNKSQKNQKKSKKKKNKR